MPLSSVITTRNAGGGEAEARQLFGVGSLAHERLGAQAAQGRCDAAHLALVRLCVQRRKHPEAFFAALHGVGLALGRRHREVLDTRAVAGDEALFPQLEEVFVHLVLERPRHHPHRCRIAALDVEVAVETVLFAHEQRLFVAVRRVQRELEARRLQAEKPQRNSRIVLAFADFARRAQVQRRADEPINSAGLSQSRDRLRDTPRQVAGALTLERVGSARRRELQGVDRIGVGEPHHALRRKLLRSGALASSFLVDHSGGGDGPHAQQTAELQQSLMHQTHGFEPLSLNAA